MWNEIKKEKKIMKNGLGPLGNCRGTSCFPRFAWKTNFHKEDERTKYKERPTKIRA